MAHIAKESWFDRIMLHVIQDVPEELGVCEFECQKADCCLQDVKQCKMNRAQALRNGPATGLH